MLIEHYRHFSDCLQQDMEVIVYGHHGKPAIVFPSQGGCAADYAGFGMVEACRSFIDEGLLQLYCVDSIDNQSWANFAAPPAERAKRHQAYHKYITEEVYSFIAGRTKNKGAKCLVTGCSMGAYHAANFFFRHPEIFDTLISLSGLYQLSMFIGDYMDQYVYYNSPLHYLPHLSDAYYLDAYKKSRIIICTGLGAWEEPMIKDAQAIDDVLSAKNIPHWVDFWGTDVNHDWPWWQKQLPYFLSHCQLG